MMRQNHHYPNRGGGGYKRTFSSRPPAPRRYRSTRNDGLGLFPVREGDVQVLRDLVRKHADHLTALVEQPLMRIIATGDLYPPVMGHWLAEYREQRLVLIPTTLVWNDHVAFARVRWADPTTVPPNFDVSRQYLLLAYDPNVPHTREDLFHDASSAMNSAAAVNGWLRLAQARVSCQIRAIDVEAPQEQQHDAPAEDNGYDNDDDGVATPDEEDEEEPAQKRTRRGI